jgi:hypothetical protein
MSEKLENLLPCPCGLQAELHEWEERDATRWAARATCNCGWEGPIGYADNHRGCFDAVNDLHKHRAIAKWNKRAPAAIEPVSVDAYRQALQEMQTTCAKNKDRSWILKMVEERAQEIRTNVGSDNLSDQDRKEMDDALKEWAKSPEAAREALLETIDIKAQAGLCAMSHAGTRAFLMDIRKIIKESRSA